MDSLSKDPLRRKNGKPTSCEPCRISKVRCDHRRPICRRCDSRGFASKCFYHPAPLSKSAARRTPKPNVPLARTGEDPPRDQALIPEESTSPCRTPYLGSTSFLSVFREPHPGLRISTPLPPQTCQERWSADHGYVASRLVQLLADFNIYEELILDHYGTSQFAIIPAPLIVQSMRRTRSHWESSSWSQNPRSEDLIYERITRNTSRPFPRLSATTTPEDFMALFTGENLRWEWIGIVFAMAGSSALVQASGTAVFSTKSQREARSPEEFAAEMTAASNACMEMCRKNEHINDLITWLYVAHINLASDVLGETSLQVYKLFGDFVSYIHAMGLHCAQCTSNPDVPLFLSETRKRLFAAAFRADKNLSTFLGRPPRLPYHYCDATLPLDVDDSLLLDQASLKSALHRLGPDGWDTTDTSAGKLRPATVIRLRYMVAVLREQVLELSLGRKTSDFADKLQATYQQCKQLWTRIPSQLHYSAHCLELLDPKACRVNLVIHLEYLHTLFQVERIRCREKNHEGSMTNLLDISMQVISAVIDFGKKYEQGTNTRISYMWIFLLYALPAAGVLATELHRCTISEIPLLCSSPRSQIIRSLGLLVSWFETADLLHIGATHKTCVEVNQMITRLLDDTLNYQPVSSSSSSYLRPSDGREQPVTVGRSGETTCEVNRSSEMSSAAQWGEKELDENLVDVTATPFSTSVDFLSWLDEVGFGTTLPELLL